MPELGHLLEKFAEYYDVFIDATLLTLKLTAASLIIAILLGLFFAFLKISKNKVLSVIADAYIGIVRGTPLIVQIFIFYFGLTEIVNMSSFWAATWGLAFHNGAYIAEIFRGSIQAVDKGQTEAGRSLGMTGTLTMRRIILPQAFRRALPPLGNQFIIGLKDSSLAAFIGMPELFNIATTLGSANFDTMTYLLIVAVYYLALVLILTVIVNLIEKKMSVSD